MLTPLLLGAGVGLVGWFIFKDLGGNAVYFARGLLLLLLFWGLGGMPGLLPGFPRGELSLLMLPEKFEVSGMASFVFVTGVLEPTTPCISI